MQKDGLGENVELKHKKVLFDRGVKNAYGTW